MSKIIIHIGTHKTGTTSIQEFLYHNRMVLQQNGIVYPEVALYEGGHHPLATQLNKELGLSIHTKAEKNIKKNRSLASFEDWATLKSLTISGCNQTVLLSTENFEWLSRPQVVRDFLGDHQYQVVVYLRRQDRYLESLYQTYVKNKNINLSLSFAKWLEKILQHENFIGNYERLVERWSKVFGEHAMIVKVFEDEIKSGLEQGFCKLLGLSDDVYQKLDVPPKSEVQRFGRESIDARCLEIVRIINRSKPAASERRLTLTAALETSDWLSASGLANKYLMKLDARERLLEQVAVGNRRIAQQYFNRSSLFELPTSAEDAGPRVLRDVIGHYSKALIKASAEKVT